MGLVYCEWTVLQRWDVEEFDTLHYITGGSGVPETHPTIPPTDLGNPVNGAYRQVDPTVYERPTRSNKRHLQWEQTHTYFYFFSSGETPTDVPKIKEEMVNPCKVGGNRSQKSIRFTSITHETS